MTHLTVAMPVYNAMPYLPEAVESILEQTLSDFNFIIINDGSTDASADYLNSINDPRVKVIHQSNLGLGTTLNRTFSLCDTEYYARMDADDISLPNRLESELDFLMQHPEVSIVGSQIAFIAANKVLRGPILPVHHELLREQLMKGRSVICHPSVMVRMDAVRRIGGYRIGGSGEDFDFMLKMSEVGRTANLNVTLHYYRINLASLVATRHSDICRGIAFAIDCTKRRMQGEKEPSLREFDEEWKKRSVISRTAEAIDKWSSIQYRKALIDMGEGRRGSSLLRLAASAICRPFATIRHLMSRVNNNGANT